MRRPKAFSTVSRANGVTAREKAINDLFDNIKVFYNRSRRHSTLKSKSPVQFVQDWISAQHGQNMAT